MSRHLVYDIETKMKYEELRKDMHILDQVDGKILSLCITDVRTKERWSCTDEASGYTSIEEGLNLLRDADRIIGHNICGFDNPAIADITGNFEQVGDSFDTLIMSQLIYPLMFVADKARPNMPKELKGRHSLKSWGYRLTNFKTDYTGGFQEWSPEMQSYCEQDVEVSVTLYEHLIAKNYSEQAIILEGKFKNLMTKQERTGVHFNCAGAEKLYNDIEKELKPLQERIQKEVPPWVEKAEFTPKVNNKARGYIKGETIIRTTTKTFNPNSRQQIVKFLKERYSWKPTVFTDNNQPKIDSEVMESLPYPEAELFTAFLVRKALMSKIKDAKGGWLNITRNGKLHGKMNTLGTRTRRCSHSAPNISQVPSPGKYKGEECRSLFYAPEGYDIVGSDMSGIQLRMLAHYLAPYDGGRYAEIVLNGDIHTSNQEAAGLPTRALAKTFIYAYLFGAGDELLGAILEPKANSARKKRVGNDIRKSFMSKTPGITQLNRDVQTAHKRGFMKLIDGGRVISPSAHTALNTLLQGSDSVCCKTWVVHSHEQLVKNKLDQYALNVIQSHDEQELVVKSEYSETVGGILVKSANTVGDLLGTRIRLDAEYKSGRDWLAVH